MELYLIRHAQSLNNARPEEFRVEDPPLTDLGRQQAVQLAGLAPTLGLTRLIVSPFLRTLETAEHIRLSTGLGPEVWVDLHEQGGCVSGPSPDVMQGRPGMTRSQINEQFPEYQLATEIDGQGWWGSKPYETVEQAMDRAKALVHRTRNEFVQSEERVAYVMHGTFKSLFLHQLVQRVVCSFHEVKNASVTKVMITTDSVSLDYFNQVNHLSDANITS